MGFVATEMGKVLTPHDLSYGRNSAAGLDIGAATHLGLEDTKGGAAVS